jgi:DNA-binding transcriptional MerR regulator
MKQVERNALAKEFHHEQVDLHQKIDEWRAWWKELAEFGDPRFGEMGVRVEEIRNVLAQHFEHEENSDLFKELGETQPGIAQQSQKLLTEHRQFIENLNRLCSRLKASEPDFDFWGDARREFEQFLDHLESHESAEKTMLELWSRADPTEK